MPYTKWRRTEEKYGKPMREVLEDLYNRLETHARVAKELGVTLKGLQRWRIEAGCKAVLRIECIEQSEPEGELEMVGK